ncbi:MAG: BspA family leucine-rich repeat surface protein [Prevotella sp.]|nr:BspA family leucine-rich repeat surface protein [Prevotella sp.]
MFRNCTHLTSLTFGENFNTANVTNMERMFYNCSGLTSLDVSNFNTANVTTMRSMFSNCSGLTSLTFGVNFTAANVTNMIGMFGYCISLTSLDVSHFNTANVTNMEGMFSNCRGLTSLTFGENFTAANVTNMYNMFSGCSSLTSLDVSNFNTAKVTTMGSMFMNCSNLTSLTFGENFATASCTSYKNGFSGCSRLRYLDFYASKNVDAIKAVDRSNASDRFYGVPQTTVIYLPKGSQAVSNVVNVVYSYNGDGNNLRCPNYYSEDKVEIELPREFKTANAEYHRNMSSNYGSVVLPYDFTTNENIQAYTLDEEHTETMYFKDAETVAAHTPFAFKKLQSGNTADFVMTDEGFGITVEATHTTSAKEGGVPFTHNENLGGWTTKGYYINETVADSTGAFYIAGDKFYKASGPLTLYPHRVTFHGAWNNSGTSGEAQFYNINTVSDSETITAIEAADLRHTRSVAAEVYDVAGRRLPEMVKGLNIVRMNDGSVRKVNIR